MLVSAHDVARELRRRLPGVGVTNVHKLLYYGQGWSLVHTGDPLFGEGLQAWTNGPVVATLWRDERYEQEIPPALALDDRQLAVVDEVVARYGHLSARQLIDMTHREPPWLNAIASEAPNPPIKRRALLAHFATVQGLDRARSVRNDDVERPAGDHPVTKEDLERMDLDERAAVLRASVVANPGELPSGVRAQIEADARLLSVGFANRSS